MNLGYYQLLKNNKSFRFLWFAQITSFMGDWFNYVALLDLVNSPSSASGETGFYTSLVLICHFLPVFLVGFIAGIYVDRYNRKWILILSDLIRAIIVLAFLFVDQQHIWLVFVIEFLLYSVSAFFLSARTAIIANLCKDNNELITANALSQITWGLMLAVGGLLGGLAVEYMGFTAAILINSVTFLISAFFIMKMDAAKSEEKSTEKSSSWNEFKEGFRYIIQNRYILAMILVKPAWAIGGGAILVLHPIFAKVIFKEGSYGIGFLFMSRGIGILLGSYLGRIIMRSFSHVSIIGILATVFFIYGIFYGIFSFMENIYLAGLMLLLATSFSANLWLFSRVSLQKLVPDHLRGRIFAHDEGFSEVVMMTSALIAGLAVDFPFHPRDISLASAILMFSCGLIYFILLIIKFLPSYNSDYILKKQ